MPCVLPFIPPVSRLSSRRPSSDTHALLRRLVNDLQVLALLRPRVVVVFARLARRLVRKTQASA